MHNDDKNLFLLSLSGIAVVVAMLWVFYGHGISMYLVGPEHEEYFHYFFNGVILSLAILGIYAFLKTALQFAGFIVSEDGLPLKVFKNALKEDDEGVFFKDLKGRYRVYNETAKQVLGFKDKNIIGKNDTDLFDSVMAHKYLIEDRRIVEKGDTIEWEVELDTPHGKESYLCKKLPFKNRHGKIVGITGICKNITVLKTFRELNKQLERHYRQLFNRLPYPVMILDTVTLAPFIFNEAMSSLLGYDKDSFPHQRMSAHVVDEDIEKFRTAMTELLEKGEGEFHIRLQTKDRDVVDVSGHAQLLLIDGKKYLHMLLHDETQNKKSTQDLIGSELKYRSLFEHANDAILIVNMDTLQIIDANENALVLLGYHRDDLMLMSIFDIDAHADNKEFLEQISNLEIYHHALYEHEIVNRKGDRYLVEINAHKVNYGDSKVYQYVMRNMNDIGMLRMANNKTGNNRPTKNDG